MKNKPAFKASLAAVLAFSALQPAMVAGASQKITDVKKGTKYYEGVQFLVKNKAIQGNHFYPDRYLTQEAAVQMLSKIWKVKAAKPQKGVFTNIPKTSKLYPLLHGMVARGILEKSKTFDKKQLVQRSELLEWSQRAFRLKPTNVQPYQDVSITSSTGKAVSSLSTFSLLHHIYPGTQLKPGQAVKRGEFAQWSHLLSKRKSVPMTIERATDKTVVINGLTYTFDKKWEGLFQSTALKKATILFTADKGKITAIDQLTITQGGSEKTPVILNGAGAMIPRLTIKTDNVKVQQLEVERLVVQEQAKKNVTFDRVKVTGKVQIESNTSAQKQNLTSSHLVRQAGLMTSMDKSRVISSNSEVIKSYNGASVIFINSDVEELVVTHPNTSVIVSNGAKIKNVILSANARIEANEGAVIEQLLIKRGTLYAEVDGTVQNCRIEAPVELEIVQNATIQNLTTAEEATIQGNGKIDHVSIADGSKSVELNIAIRQLEVLTAEKIELIGTPKIDKLTIGESATSVALKIESNIQEVIIASKEVKMDVGTGVQITSLSIPAGSNVTDLITNYDKVDEQIKNPPIIIPPTTDSGTNPPTTGGGTNPPTTGGGTNPPQTKISDELDQVLDMKNDRYAVFDLTEELLDKLIASKEIESYQPELINDYRMYIHSMNDEELNSAEDVRRVLRKVKELRDSHVTEEQSLTLTPVLSKWDDSERYDLSFNEPNIVRAYFKRDGKLVRTERYDDEMHSNYFGNFEKVGQEYRMWSSYHYDEVIFEKKDGSYSHLTINQTGQKDGMVYFTELNGKDIVIPSMQYKGEINPITPGDEDYPYLNFDRFVYYEIPQMQEGVDIAHDGRQIDNDIDQWTSYWNEEGKAIVGILKSLYKEGYFKGDLLIPGYAPTPFESEVTLEEVDKEKPFQFIIERYGSESLLNRLGVDLSDETVSYPIRLETVDGQAIQMKDITIERIPNRYSDNLDEADTMLSIDSNELKINLIKSGSDTYLIKLGDFEQEVSIDVFERFETKAIPVNKIKSKEMALEWIRRSILLNDVSSLPIELFKKIDPSYTAEGMPIYQAMLEQIDDEKAGDLTDFQEESNLLNQKLFQLLETKDEDFKVLTPSWILNDLENPHLFVGNDDVLFVKQPNGTFNMRNGFNMSLEKVDDRYFTNRYPLDIERRGEYEYYKFNQDTNTIERLQVEFGAAKNTLREVLRINGDSIEEFLKKNESSENTDQETDIPDSENEPTDDGDTNVPIDENIVQSSN